MRFLVRGILASSEGLDVSLPDWRAQRIPGLDNRRIAGGIEATVVNRRFRSLRIWADPVNACYGDVTPVDSGRVVNEISGSEDRRLGASPRLKSRFQQETHR